MLRNSAEHLVQTLRGRHGSLDDKAANVLPALLEQGDEVVDGQHDVGDQLLVGHANIANGDTKAQNLLKLELDGGLNVRDLGGHVFGVRDGGGEFASCSKNSELAIWTENNGKNNQKQERTLGKTGTQETRNLLDETLGSDESVVLASKLFDELLVLVQLPEVLGGHGIETVVLGTVKVVLVTKNTIISKFIRQLSIPFSLSS